MKSMFKLMLVALFLTTPLIAQSAPAQTDEPPAATEQEPPKEPEAQAPTNEELAGRIESLVEAFTETKNVVDVLNRLRIAGYVQAEYVHSDASQNQLTSSTATRNLDTFRVRRGRVNFQYVFAPTGRFVIQPDLSSSGVALRDAYVELSEPWTQWKNTLTGGQFKVPFGHEIRYSSRDREMPERSLVVRTLFPGERDRGVMLSGNGMQERFNYRLGVFNGNGVNLDRDLNKRKDLAGRVGASLGPVDFGVSGYRGNELVTLASSGSPLPQKEFDKDRYGVDFQWVTPLEGLGVRGEYIKGTQPPAANAGLTARAADVDGWYLYAVQSLGTKHQFVLRIDEYDPNTDVNGNSTRTIGGAYIHHWDANIKIMFAYEQPKLERNDPDDDLVTIRMQYSF